MTRDSHPVLAVVAPTADSDAYPLSQALPHLSGHYDIHVLVLRGRPDPGSPHRQVTIEELGLPGPSLRFALGDDELSALAKPYFLKWLIHDTSEVHFIHGGCLLNQAPVFSEPMDRFDMEILPLLHLDLARTKPGIAAALESGLGDPSGAVLRIRASEGLGQLLEDWADWMRSAYLLDPVRSLVDAERIWLRALPASHASVGWSHEPVVALWSDLHPEGPDFRVIDTSGFASYHHTDGQAFSLMNRRTHSGHAIDELERRLSIKQIVPTAPQYRSGEEATSLARQILRATDPWGHRWREPADDTSEPSFKQWLLEEDSRGLPRFAQALFWARPDLQRSFRPQTTPVDDFVHWLALNRVGIGAKTPPIPDRDGAVGRAVRFARRRLGRAVGRTLPTLTSRRGEPRSPVGLNLVGFASAETGLGEAMRGTLNQLRGAGYRVSVLDVSDRIYARQRALQLDEIPVGVPHDVTIFHLNPTELLDYANHALAYRLTGSWQIGFWFWETETIPDSWNAAFDMVDEVWVASSYLHDTFSRVTQKPVTVMGLPVEVPPDIDAVRERFQVPDGAFAVSYITDAYSGLERKDPLRAIRAFQLAFGPDYDGVHLLLKIGNLEKFPELRRRLHDHAAGMPITIVSEYLDRDDLWALLACSDAYLSLHASEGFGLTILEAMALGIPPVVTAYGGSMDFTDATNSLLVGYRLTPARGGPGDIYTGSGRWAEPDLDEAAGHLRTLRADGDLRARLGERARLCARRYSPESFGQRLGERLGELGLTPEANH